MKKVFSLMLLLAAMFTYTACGDDDEKDNAKLSKTAYTMYHKDSQYIEGTNLSDIVWDSDDEFVATVKNNSITGQYVGKTTVKSATKKLTFSVEVKPAYSTYEEPHLDWNASKSTIKARYGTPTSESTNSLIYETSNTNVPILLFVFENGKMYTCGVVCKISAAYELVDFLSERYVPVKVDKDNYSATFVHCNGKISDPQIDYVIAMQYNSSMGGIGVAYTKYESSKSRNYDNIDFNTTFQELENALK